MDSIFPGDLAAPRGRALAWADSLLVDHAVFRLVWRNWGEVVPGRLYRSNHPTPGQLARLARRRRLRTVVNLRGPAGNGSDALAREAAVRLGLAYVDAPLGSRAVSRERVLALCEVFRRMETPALVHCKSGADRAGFAAGLYLLLNGGSSDAALAQLSWRFGHLRRSRAGVLDEFFRLYAREAEGRVPFLDWVREGYDEATLRQGFTSGRLMGYLNDHVLRRE